MMTWKAFVFAQPATKLLFPAVVLNTKHNLRRKKKKRLTNQ